MKRLFSLLLVLALVLAAFPVSASAQAAEQLQVNTPTFYDSGAVKSVTASFVWASDGSVYDVHLALSTKKLEGGLGKDTTKHYDGFIDFADKGIIANKGYKSITEAIIDNNTKYKIIYYQNIGTLTKRNEPYVKTINFAANTIPLNVDQEYFLYLWIKDSNGNFYPDNLICVFEVKDGALKWTPASVPSGLSNEEQNYYRNYYIASNFEELTTGTPRDITVKSNGEYMTRSTDSGAETQTTNGAITPIIYTAKEGYYFPESYSVPTQNGIMVKRLSESQIMVCGTPTANVEFQLSADLVTNNPNNSNPTHTCQPSNWKWDDTHHWYYTCLDPNCTKTRVSSVSGYGEHVYDNDYDTVCNVCNYSRIAPTERAETGDITNIPLWTMLFFSGAALVWLQLEQRKRQYF